MSLSAREQQALESIEDQLAESDPGLASRLGMFSRLASGEKMPARTEIHPLRPPATGRLYRNRRPRRIAALWNPRRLCRRLGWNRGAALLWLLISVGMTAVALALTDHGPGECVQPWATACAGPPPAHVVRLPSSHGAAAIWAESGHAGGIAGSGDVVRHPGTAPPSPHTTSAAERLSRKDPQLMGRSLSEAAPRAPARMRRT